MWKKQSWQTGMDFPSNLEFISGHSAKEEEEKEEAVYNLAMVMLTCKKPEFLFLFSLGALWCLFILL